MIFTRYSEQIESLAGISLVSCGHIFAEPNREIYRPQGRNDWLLFFIAKESETFFLDKTVKAGKGSCIIFAPGEKQHHIYEGSKTAEFYYVHFKCEHLPDGIKLESSKIYSTASQKQIVLIFEEIIEETLKKRPHYEILSISRLLQLLAILQRDATVESYSKNRSWSNVADAIQYMNRYYDQNTKLDEYAAMCCMSKYHFSRVFKEVTGTSPLEYRNRIRIEYAKEMLENTFLLINEIGESLGYTSPAYFSDAFKKATGLSPKEYRDQKNQG